MISRTLRNAKGKGYRGRYRSSPPAAPRHSERSKPRTLRLAESKNPGAVRLTTIVSPFPTTGAHPFWPPGTPRLKPWVSRTHKRLRGFSPCGIAFCLFTASLFVRPLSAQPVKLLLPETNSTVTLSFTHDKESPDQYRSIIIHSSGQTTTFTAHDPVLRIPATRRERKEAFIWNADIPGLKIDPSRFFLVGQYTAANKPHTLLFFLSPGYASDAASVLIVGFSAEGKPFRVFEDEYEMTSFEQSDDGALLTGKESLSEGLCTSGDPHGPSSATYDPFSVYLIHPDSKPIYQLAASRAYNLKHYAWAGPQAGGRYIVIENLPGHPKFFVVPGPRAEKLLAKVKCIP